MGNITRRDFLKGGIAGAATLAASGLLNAISAKESVAFADEAKDTAKAPVPAWTELNMIITSDSIMVITCSYHLKKNV